MGKSIPVTLGRFTFPSKQAAKAALREIRDRHQDGVPILEEDAVDILLEVVAAHPQAKEKVGAGIRGFFVGKAPEFSTRCFYLRRIDGSDTEFSWNETITPTKSIDRLRMACRNAIEDQKTGFKDAKWPWSDIQPRVCPITGEPFSRSEAHVDHQPPRTLKSLVAAWLAVENLAVDEVQIDHIGDLRSVDTFAKSDQRESWRTYHRDHAQLRLISAEGNLRQGARLLGL
jgi:hypothetical protein